MTSATGPGTLVSPRRVLTVAWISGLAVSLYVAMMAVILPRVAASLKLSFSAATWVQVAFLLALTVVLVPAGRISDESDRWTAFRFGVAVFLVAAVAASLSPSAGWLLAATAAQGVGAAFVWATNMPLITAAFPESERGRSLGVYSVSISVGRAAGPVVGGVVVAHLPWRAAFAVLVPPLVVALLAAPRGRGRLQVRGVQPFHVALLALGLAVALVTLTFAPLWGWRSPRVLAGSAVVAGSLALFGWQQWNSRRPLLDPRMFLRNRVLAASNLSLAIAHLSTFGVVLLTAVHLQLVDGYSVERTGVLLLAQSGAMMVVSPVAGRLSDRLGSRRLTAGGLAVVAIGLAGLATIPSGTGSVRVVVPLMVVGAGMATFTVPNHSAILGSVGHEDRGTVVAALATVRGLGQAASVALLGALAAASLGPEGAETIFLGGTAAGAADLYATGYRIAVTVGAGLSILGAVVAHSRGPDAPPPTEDRPDQVGGSLPRGMPSRRDDY